MRRDMKWLGIIFLAGCLLAIVMQVLDNWLR